MKKSLFSLFVLLSSMGAASCAEVSTVLPSQSAAETPQTAHPFFRSAELPQWSKLTAAQALADAREAVRLARERVQTILAITPQEATFENTVLAVDEASDELQCVMMLMQHISFASDSVENRAAMDEIAKLMADCTAEIFGDERLWLLLQSASAPEKTAHLSPAKKRVVQQMIDIFIDNGATLSPEKKAIKNELDKEMLLLSLQYEKNMQDFMQNWELLVTDADALNSVPAAVMADMAAAAQEKGLEGWLITLRDGTAVNVMALCRVEHIRKACWQALHGYGVGTPYDNAPVIAALMEKRQAFAELLGFKNFADYAARSRMVKHGGEALAFVDDLMRKIKPAYDEEVRAVMQAYSDYIGKPVKELQPWDELQALSVYGSLESGVTSGMLAPYLKCTDVLNGMFAVYGKLLGIHFKQLPTVCLQPGQVCPADKVEVWHPDVKCVAVYDTASGTHLGTFYLDLYRRDHKRSGGWCAPLRLANPGPNGEICEPHVAALMTNFEPREKGKPNCLTHENLVVLFHEFGHMLHHMLSHTELKGHCALGVAWDFCEFPSTLSENWAWSPEVLSTFARHYKTRKPCPLPMLQQLQHSRRVLQAYTYMETLRKAKLDMEIHMHYNNLFKGRCIDEVSAQILGEYQFPYASLPYSLLRDLPHSFSGGYAAGVYSYLWSEVMAADAYTKFEEAGLLNPEIGKKYRETILDKGDSIPADELYRMFMGRNPDTEAFLKVHNLNR